MRRRRLGLKISLCDYPACPGARATFFGSLYSAAPAAYSSSDPSNLACCWIDGMELPARKTCDGFIGVVRHFLGEKSLYGLTSVRAPKEKRRQWCNHRDTQAR